MRPGPKPARDFEAGSVSRRTSESMKVSGGMIEWTRRGAGPGSTVAAELAPIDERLWGTSLTPGGPLRGTAFAHAATLRGKWGAVLVASGHRLSGWIVPPDCATRAEAAEAYGRTGRPEAEGGL